MFNVGGGELLVIFLVALVVLGPTKLPDAARQVGKVMGEFRRLSSGFQNEFRQAMNDPVSHAVKSAEKADPTTPDVTEVASLPATDKTNDSESNDAGTSDGDEKPAEESKVPTQVESTPIVVDPPFASSKPVEPLPHALTGAVVDEEAPTIDTEATEGRPVSAEPVSADVETVPEPQDPPMFGDR